MKKELYVRRRLRESDLGRIVPVKIPDKKDSVGFDREVSKQLNLLREESVEFRKVSENGGDSDISGKFNSISSRMVQLVEREGCYYPDSIKKEVVSIAIGSGGPVFSNLFFSNNVSESLKRVPMNCKAV